MSPGIKGFLMNAKKEKIRIETNYCISKMEVLLDDFKPLERRLNSGLLLHKFEMEWFQGAIDKFRELSLRLKELGFDNCFLIYRDKVCHGTQLFKCDYCNEKRN